MLGGDLFMEATAQGQELETAVKLRDDVTNTVVDNAQADSVADIPMGGTEVYEEGQVADVAVGAAAMPDARSEEGR